MEEYKSRSGAKTILGIVLIIVGALYFLDSLDIVFFNVPRIIFSFPFVIFMIGLIITLSSNRKGLGIILLLIGGLWLMPRVFPDIDIDGGVIISILIITLGVYIIFKHRGRSSASVDTTGTASSQRNITADYIDEVSIFGGGERMVNSDNFKGGNVTAIFGGSEIHLSGCKLAEGTNVIDVLAIFGGAEIRVPRDWNVIVNATPIFGGFSNKIVRDPNQPIDTSRVLVIKGLAMFGGIEINSKF